MKYYQDITLIPDADISCYFLWSHVFTALHLALVEQRNQYQVKTIAVSFPEYSETTLGTKLRVLAEDEAVLQQFDAEKVFGRLKDYVHITRIRKIVPARIKGYAIYRRYQPDNSLHQKARRFVRRHDHISYDQALQLMKSKKMDIQLPYIQMKSKTNHNPFRLFIQKISAEKTESYEFGTYGLSSSAAVPEF